MLIGGMELKDWQKQEASFKKDFVGRQTTGSGKYPHDKGDYSASRILIEAKTTESDQYILRTSTIHKIETEALMKDKQYVLQINFGKRNPYRVAIIDYEFLKELLYDACFEERPEKK